MTELLNRLTKTSGSIASIASFGTGFGLRFPQIAFAPEGGAGSGGGSDEGEADEGDDEDEDDAGNEGGSDEGQSDDDDAGNEGTDKKPTDREAKLLKESLSRKKALKDAQKALATANAALKAFEGIDPAKVRKLMKDQQTAEANAAEARGEYEESKRILQEAHTEELNAKDVLLAESNTTIKGLQDRINELTIGAKFTSSKFVSEELVLTPTKARQVYGANFEIAEDGTLTAYDRPASQEGRKKLLNKKSGEPATFDDAMRQLIDADSDRDHLLRSKTKGGAGSGTKENGGKTPAKAPDTFGLSRIEAALAASRKK
ncbi:DUF6651 domain-containing protein [Aureimonas sp. AU40]|uniref:DUF6651 domain-containing protein n=1 Tax=Aureimonas sp. AU40 TaxID=1637747 RepID=UPI000780AF84|nr:DUF6651 domain-containing protein [Aureimonas sp. AU40]